jgi:hypothetical protein
MPTIDAARIAPLAGKKTTGTAIVRMWSLDMFGNRWLDMVEQETPVEYLGNGAFGADELDHRQYNCSEQFEAAMPGCVDCSDGSGNRDGATYDTRWGAFPQGLVAGEFPSMDMCEMHVDNGCAGWSHTHYGMRNFGEGNGFAMEIQTELVIDI